MDSSKKALAILEVSQYTRNVFMIAQRDNGKYSWLCPNCFAMGAVEFDSTTATKEVHKDEAIHRVVCNGS